MNKTVSEGPDLLGAVGTGAQKVVSSVERYVAAAQALKDYITSLIAGPCPNSDLLRQNNECESDDKYESICLKSEEVKKLYRLPPFGNEKDGGPPLSVRCTLAKQYCHDKYVQESAFFSSTNNPNFAMWHQYNNIDFSAVMVEHLNEAIAAGYVNQATINALIAQAQSGDRGALAALIAIALTSAQGANWQDFEVSTGMIYYGSEGAYVRHMRKTDPHFSSGGNCATFVSFAWLMAGLPTSDTWGPGGPNSAYRHTRPWESYAPPLPNDLIALQGTDTFRTAVPSLRNYLVNDLGHQKEQYGSDTFLSDYNLWGAGDLVFNEDDPSTKQDESHVLIIVGWSINIPSYVPSANNPAPPIFPTYNEASGYFGSHPSECERWNTPCNLILWGVEHGGSYPQPYARPVDQMGTGTQAYVINM